MEDSAATAALVGIVLALVEMVKKLVNKTDSPGNNRNLDYKMEMLDGQMRGLLEKFDDLQKSFYEFREETRIRWARSGEDE